MDKNLYVIIEEHLLPKKQGVAHVRENKHHTLGRKPEGKKAEHEKPTGISSLFHNHFSHNPPA